MNISAAKWAGLGVKLDYHEQKNSVHVYLEVKAMVFLNLSVFFI